LPSSCFMAGDRFVTRACPFEKHGKHGIPKHEIAAAVINVVERRPAEGPVDSRCVNAAA
jgi:hypothetical protein